MIGRAPSHLRAALGILVRRLRQRRARPETHSRVPRRRLAAEAHGIFLDPRHVRRYNRLSGCPEGPESDVVPPLYSSMWETALALDLFSSDELPFPGRGIVHVESEVVSVRPLRLNDRIRCRVEIEVAEPHPRGLRLTLKSRHWNASGQLCQENALILLVPSAPLQPPAVTPPSDRGAWGVDDEEWLTLADWNLPGSLGRRYARLSGDLNPIHLSRFTARLLGFERTVLHGFCTAAMVTGALATKLWNGDPAALRRLRIHFGAPLLLPARARLEVAHDGETGVGRFRVIDSGGNREGRPYAEGEFVGS